MVETVMVQDWAEKRGIDCEEEEVVMSAWAVSRSRYGQVVLAGGRTHQVGAKIFQVHELDSHHLV